MPLHRIVEYFCEACSSCRSGDQLLMLTIEAARELGFDHVALVHGMYFRCPGHQLIRLDNFGEWAEIYVERRYFLDDPALLACQRDNRPFVWSKLSELVPFGRRQTNVLLEAGRHGFCNGFSLPVGVTGEPTGCCSFSCAGPELPSRWHCRAAALIAAEAFGEARRLHGFPARSPPLPHLGKRELECLRLIAIGKTDPLIGQILNLSPATIRTYMRTLRHKFDVVSRQQLAVEALRFGLVGFDDAIPSS